MKINRDYLTDELIQRANTIEALDPVTRRVFQVWHTEPSGNEYPGTRIGSLLVYLPCIEFGQLKDRVRAVKGRLSALAESLSL